MSKNLEDLTLYGTASRDRYLKQSFNDCMQNVVDPSTATFPSEVLTERQRAEDEKAIINSLTIYNETTTYEINDYIIDCNSGNIYKSLIATNTNNALTDVSSWEFINLTIDF